jgi:hypothetical protein
MLLETGNGHVQDIGQEATVGLREVALNQKKRVYCGSMEFVQFFFYRFKQC